MDEPRELSLLLDDGTVIRDEGWLSVADVHRSYHGFGVRRVYGVIVYADTGEIHPHCKIDLPASPENNSPLG